MDKKNTIYSGDPLPALFLTEMVRELNEVQVFLEVLSSEEALLLESVGTKKRVKKGANLFRQGEYHDGIFLIKEGRVRTFCSSPSGRQLTLAYWTPGHFVGGRRFLVVLTFGQEMPLRTLLIVSEGFSHPTLNRGRASFCLLSHKCIDC